VDLGERVTSRLAALTPAERRVADVVLARRQLVAFGTVAELAAEAGAGAATVVRLAGKLGFDGFSELQQQVRAELARQLRPAVERIREPAADDPIGRHLAEETENVRASLESLTDELLTTVVEHLTDPGRSVAIVSGDASAGVGRQLAIELGALRPGVGLIDGNPVAVAQRLALHETGDVLIAMDVRRYDRWVVEAVDWARRQGWWIVSITDSVVSPLAEAADAIVVVRAASPGPFDSHTGTLAVCGLLVAATAARLRATAADRLDRAEQAWREAAVLDER
jgi:DNA-binding MurR/RpiR family transcriptional regulator